jgi:[acyl-carrier-protein] S-malonyltransferase
MESAYLTLSQALEETPMLAPRVPVVCNVDAKAVGDAENIRCTLADQVTGSVCWSQSIEYMIDHLHITNFLELGPGGVIAGLVGRIRKGTPVVSVSDVTTLDEALAILAAAE